MLAFLKKLFGRQASAEDERPDNENEQETAAQKEKNELINVVSCEVVDVEIVDDTLH